MYASEQGGKMTAAGGNSGLREEWDQRNYQYLSDLDKRCGKSRRKSSVTIGSFVTLLEDLSKDEQSGDDDDEDAFIEARLRQISDTLNNKNRQQARRTPGDMEDLAHSMQSTSLTLNDIFPDTSADTKGGAQSLNRSSMHGSSRMSLCSRRSARMSLVLRQSYLDSMFGSEDESFEKSHIPDVFGSKRNKRDSVITASTKQLVSTVFGVEGASLASAPPGTEDKLLRGALDPVKVDQLMAEVNGFGESEDSYAIFTNAMNSSQRNIENIVQKTVREEQQRNLRQIQLDSISRAVTENPYFRGSRDQDDSNTALRSSYLNSSMDSSMNSTLRDLMRDL